MGGGDTPHRHISGSSMATLEQILNGMIEFRDEVYSRFTSLDQQNAATQAKLIEIDTKAAAAVEAAMSDRQVQTICPHCGGDGVKPDGSSCPDCGGTGYRAAGKIAVFG